MSTRVRVFAPASVSNLGPGFDVIGLALEHPGDSVQVERSDDPGVEIAGVSGDGGVLSRDPTLNVAGVAAASVLRRLQHKSGVALGAAQVPRGIRLWLHKGMPLASGLGSSAASSVAASVAVNELCGRPLSRLELLASAMEGERVASGAPHADNAAPSLLGGIVLIRSYDPLDVLELPVPAGLWVAVVHPHCSVKTAEARALVMGRGFRIEQCVANLGNLGALVSALYRADLALLGRSIEDRLVEPIRARLIPGFAEVKAAARGTGALGCSISGSGPSVFALADDEARVASVAEAMREAFRRSGGLESDAYVGPVNAAGATVESDAAA
jgi:homoserine kinase